MDVSRWPIDRIMQLPDWCFGRRWWIGTYLGTTNDVVNYFKIEENLPDWFVVWNITLTNSIATAGYLPRITIRLAQEVPDVNTVKTFDRLFKHMSTPSQMYEFYWNRFSQLQISDMRVAIESKGRTIVGAYKIVAGTGAHESSIAILISSIPREVPDWVVSGLVGVQM